MKKSMELLALNLATHAGPNIKLKSTFFPLPGKIWTTTFSTRWKTMTPTVIFCQTEEKGLFLNVTGMTFQVHVFK